MQTQEKDLHKHSPEVEEILHKKPSFLVRNGIFLLVFIIAILLAGTHFIRYPERLAAPVRFDSCPASDSGICKGRLTLTEDAASIIKQGQSVQLILHSEFTGQVKETEGTIVSIKPFGYGDYVRVVILPDKPDTLEGFSGTAYIPTGESTFLSKILNPVVALFRSADH